MIKVLGTGNTLHDIFPSASPEMSGQSVLSEDVLLEIFTLVGQGARAPLLNPTLVNRQWHAVAQLIIDKTIELTICSRYKARNLRVLGRLRRQASLQGRVQHLAVRDVHTKQRVPIGLADEPPIDAWALGEYFGHGYELKDPDEGPLLAQLNAIQPAMAASQLRSFTWAAIPPITSGIVTALASVESIDVHVRLNASAIGTAAWSYTPVTNRAVVSRLLPLAASLRTLQLCVPNEDTKGRKVLCALHELVSACGRLTEFNVHALGRLSAVTTPVWHLRESNGPPRMRALNAKYAKYRDWGTNGSMISPAAPLMGMWSINTGSTGLSQSLRTLSLQNFCTCNLDTIVLAQVVHLPNLFSLQLSCLRLFKAMQSGLPRLQSLTLSLAEGEHWDVSQQLRALPSAACKSFWSDTDVGEVLVGCNGLRELQVLGNPDAVTESTLIHIGKTIRKLSLFRREAYAASAAVSRINARMAYHSHGMITYDIPWTRMSHMPSLIESLGMACPLLRDLACDAPNASTEMDAFLEALTTHLPRLDHLHIRRSLEPYAESLRADKYSYARFAEVSVATLWKVLNKAMPRVELKVTIGDTLSWDDKVTSTRVSCDASSRTYVVTRVYPDLTHALDNTSEPNYRIMHLERMDADMALSEGRSGPLTDYWQKQSATIDYFAKPMNIPVYPRNHLDNGRETTPPRFPRRRGLSHQPDAIEEQRQGRLDEFNNSLRAQHDAELAEAVRPTRDFY